MKQAKYKVVITPCDYDNVELERKILEPIGAEVIRIETHDEREIMEIVKDADALLVQHADINREFIKNLKKCKILARYGVGYDDFDLEAATEYGIYASNVPDYCIDEVSTHALALLLALERKVVLYNDDLRKREIWDSHAERPMYNLRKQTLGIIGFGRIGRAFCQKAKPIFGKIVVCDPYIDESIFDEYEVEKAFLEEVLQKSDAVSLHVPLFKVPTKIYQVTYHLIGEEQLKMMKKTAYIVNTSRGPVIDDKALRKALTHDWIAGAGLDVIENEPTIQNSSEIAERYRTLLEKGKLIITHHCAYLSEDSVVESRSRATREVVRVLQDGIPPKNLLNPEVLN